MRKKFLICAIAVLALAVLGFGVLAWRPAIAPVVTPAPESFPPALVARGAELAGGGYCAECHTARGGQPFAGGYAMATSFGVIYSTNITPDSATGIGCWSEAAFARALREGIARDGSLLFPAFPYDHFNRLSDQDVQALYAYLMTRTAVHRPARENGLPFPLNIRYLQAGWRLLFFRSARFKSDASKDAAWNRGAYLAQSLAHCGACHTPRNILGAEMSGHAYAGATIDNWTAPPLTAANPGPVSWTREELYGYLRNGFSVLHGSAAGPMAPVVHGLAALPDEDVRALAAYFADISRAGHGASAAPTASGASEDSSLDAGEPVDAGARLYRTACASCHYDPGRTPRAMRPNLALNSALSLPEPNNIIAVVLGGINARDGIPGVVMPGFDRALSDDDIALILTYLRRTRTSLPPWPDLPARIAAMRARLDASP